MPELFPESQGRGSLSLYFNLFVYLYIKWVFVDNIVGSTHSHILGLLIGVCGPFIFKVIIDAAGLISTTFFNCLLFLVHVLCFLFRLLFFFCSLWF